jgi:hypothetical protein
MPEPVSKRTRAQYSLADRELDALEALLNKTSSPTRSPAHESDCHASVDIEETEWRRFLLQLQAEAASVTSAREDDSGEDGDYSYHADTTRLQEGREEWAKRGRFEIPLDEVRGLVSDSTNLAKRITRHRNLHDNGKRKRPRRQTTHERPCREHARTDHSHAALTGLGEDCETGLSTGARGEIACFSSEQLRHVQIQMHLHVQMLVQVMLVARDAMRAELSYLKVALLPYGMLCELCTYADVTCAAKQLALRPNYATPLTPDHVASTLGVANDVWLPRISVRSLSFGWPASIFAVPGMHLLPDVLFVHAGLRTLYNAPDAVARLQLGQKLALCDFDGPRLLRALISFLNPAYLPKKELQTRSVFCDAEDELLALGLRRFGFDRLDVIQTTLLPSKSVYQLERRCSLCTRRHAPNSSIKRVHAERFAGVLTPAEEALLGRGVQAFGEDWERIRNSLLPHRDTDHLSRCWKHKVAPSAHLRAEPLLLPSSPYVYGVESWCVGALGWGQFTPVCARPREDRLTHAPDEEQLTSTDDEDL